MSASRGEKIIRFQNLYKKYSSLAFTNPSDRPIAVNGMQSRLLKAFGTRGGYGIFDDNNISKSSHGGLLRRSLLLYRPVHKTFTRIEFPREKELEFRVPSWSWMAYMGEIDFLELEFGKIEWMEIRSPWSNVMNSKTELSIKKESDGCPTIWGTVREIIGDAEKDSAGQLYYDLHSGPQVNNKIECVVLGIEKKKSTTMARLHYFILVEPVGDARHPTQGNNRYQRVGAGYMPGSCISSGEREIKIC